MGRPPEPVPQDVADALLSWLYEGKSLLSFCQQPGMPSNRTISDWKAKDPEFAAAFARARADGAALLVDLAQHVADDGRNDTYTDDEGNEKVDHDIVQRSKLRVDTLLKRAACFCPSQFGTKVQLGGDASSPPIKVEQQGPTPPEERDLRAWAAKLAAMVADSGGGC